MQNDAPRIAVVEDNEALRDLFCDVLVAADYGVDGYDSAEAFLSSDWRSYALAVVDLQLVKMHGVTLIRTICRDVKCIAVTGSDVTLRAQALLTGAAVAIPKPIKIDALRHAVAFALAL